MLAILFILLVGIGIVLSAGLGQGMVYWLGKIK